MDWRLAGAPYTDGKPIKYDLPALFAWHSEWIRKPPSNSKSKGVDDLRQKAITALIEEVEESTGIAKVQAAKAILSIQEKEAAPLDAPVISFIEIEKTPGYATATATGTIMQSCPKCGHVVIERPTNEADLHGSDVGQKPRAKRRNTN